MAGKKDSKGRRKWGNGKEEGWGTAQEKQNARKNVKRKKENTVRKQLHTNLNTLLHLSVRSLPRAWQHQKEWQEVIFTLTDSSFDLLTRIFWENCFLIRRIHSLQCPYILSFGKSRAPGRSPWRGGEESQTSPPVAVVINLKRMSESHGSWWEYKCPNPSPFHSTLGWDLPKLPSNSNEQSELWTLL